MTEKLIHAKNLIYLIISFIVTSSNNGSIVKTDAFILTSHKYNEKLTQHKIPFHKY